MGRPKTCEHCRWWHRLPETFDNGTPMGSCLFSPPRLSSVVLTYLLENVEEDVIGTRIMAAATVGPVTAATAFCSAFAQRETTGVDAPKMEPMMVPRSG